MGELYIVFWIMLALIGGLLYVKFKPDSYQSLLLDKEEAHKIASRFIRSYCGTDVSGWRYYAMYWHDRDTVNKLHHLGILDKVRPILYDWGLIEAWRIRFVGDNRSIIVGINAKSEVTFLNVDMHRKATPQKSTPILSGDQLQKELSSSKIGVWCKAKFIGEGKKEEDLEDVHTYWYLIESDEIRMKMTAVVANGYLINITTEQEINTNKMNNAVKKEYVESALNISGVLGSLLTVMIALIVLLMLDLHTNVVFSFILGMITFIASMLTVREDIQLGIVNAYDSRITEKMVYIMGIVSALLASLASGFVTFISSLAGVPLSEMLGIPLMENMKDQLLGGMGAGFASLGLSTWLFYVVKRMGFVRISPELSDRTVYMSGFNLKQGLSVSLQSSMSEEVVHRLLMIPALWWLTGNVYVAIGVSSILWASLHQATGYHPRYVRWGQLVALGFVLGILFVHLGFLSAFLAHFIHNFILICTPLLQFRYQLRRGSDKAVNHTSFR